MEPLIRFKDGLHIASLMTVFGSDIRRNIHLSTPNSTGHLALAGFKLLRLGQQPINLRVVSDKQGAKGRLGHGGTLAPGRNPFNSPELSNCNSASKRAGVRITR